MCPPATLHDKNCGHKREGGAKTNYTKSKPPRGRAPDQCSPCGGPAGPPRNPTTSFLTATTLIYAIGAGITAAAGTRLALQLFLVKGFRLDSFQLPDYKSPALLFIVTTSPSRDWVICAPAAFLGCGSRSENCIEKYRKSSYFYSNDTDNDDVVFQVLGLFCSKSSVS